MTSDAGLRDPHTFAIIGAAMAVHTGARSLEYRRVVLSLRAVDVTATAFRWDSMVCRPAGGRSIPPA